MVDTLQTGKPIDFSIMPSFKCNLNCWFCMYDAGENNQQVLNYEKTKLFLSHFDWSKINAFGFYGGEPTIEMELYNKFIELVPDDIPKFVITNGAWSKWDLDEIDCVLEWFTKHKFHVIVSGTPEHISHQYRPFLEQLNQACPDGFELKKPDEIHAQGRAKGHKGIVNDCQFTCQRKDRNIRLGLKPDGNIVFQNCHGEYHVVWNYEKPFEGMAETALKVSQECLASKVMNLELPAPPEAEQGEMT